MSILTFRPLAKPNDPKLKKKLDEMGHVHFLLDVMGLDQMGLDQMGIDQMGWHQIYFYHGVNSTIAAKLVANT